MALSNWFIVAWDENGDNYLEVPKVTDGEYTAEVYKNWIDLRKGDKPIATIYSGHITVGRITIHTKKGKQQSICGFIEWFEGEGDNIETHTIYFIAGYTFKDDEDVGCLPETIEDFKKWVNRVLKEEYFTEEPIKFKPAISQNQGDLFFSKELGLPRQYQKVGEKPPKAYFDIMLGDCK